MTLVIDHLEKRGVRFEVLPHRRATTARAEAEVLGASPLEVLKVIVLDTMEGHALAVIPCHRRLDLGKVRRLLGDPHVELATEDELGQDLAEFELGAIPPLGSLLHLPMLIDTEVFRHSKVTFAAGLQRESVRMDPQDLLTGATITVAPIVDAIDMRTDPAVEFAPG